MPWKEAFSLFDKKGNGTVSSENLGDLLRALGQNPTQAEVASLVQQVGGDAKRDVEIDFGTFLTILTRPDGFKSAGTAQEFIQGFQVFDKEGTGFISAGELRYVLTSLGEKLSNEEVDELFKDINIDKDGQIDYVAATQGRLAETAEQEYAVEQKAIRAGATRLDEAQTPSSFPIDLLTGTQPARQKSPTPIILPNPSNPSYALAARLLPSTVAEQFAILHACIKSGDMHRAERIMKDLYRTKPEEMKTFATVHVHNAFLDGFVEGGQSQYASSHVPDMKACADWFDIMKRHGVEPDRDTFAILAKGFKRVDAFPVFKSILLEMKTKYNIPVAHMIQSTYMTDNDIAAFRDVARDNNLALNGEAAELFRELQEATKVMIGDAFVEGESQGDLLHDARMTETQQSIPEARPMQTPGVRFLKEHLQTLHESLESAGKSDPLQLQLKLEERAYEVALEKLNYERELARARGDNLNAMNLSPLKKMMWEWHTKLVPLIDQEIALCEQGAKDNERKQYGPFLRLLPSSKLSVITILELVRLHNTSGITDGMKMARALIEVGKAVEMEVNAVEMKKRTNSRMVAKNKQVHQLFASGRLFNMAVRRAHMQLAKQGQAGTGGMVGEWTPIWPSSVRAKVGSVLTSLLIEAAKIPVPSHDPATGKKIIENIPAFFHTYQYLRGKRIGIIKFSPHLTELISREPLRDTLHPRLLPMIVHPRPWLTWNSGGYMATKSTCMRIKDSPEQVAYLKQASDRDQLGAVLTGLDVLGSTRWSVNKNVFNVVLDAWNSGKPLADIPAEVKLGQTVIPKPPNYDTDPKAKGQWIAQMKAQQNKERNEHSLRCDVNYKVETARAFLDQPMYFPHNMDFRGRAYPIPPTLNHMGNDLCRGLMQFDLAKPLGAQGFRWLKIHLANLHGFDKHSFMERIEFAESNLEHVFDSADKPLTGNMWWLKAEDPWQCLAACFELTAAIRSGSPETFPSRLPVHQDGTCNGLQHYAALGGDMAGARAVNLEPGDRPADVYTGVADLVNKTIEQEAAAGAPDAQILVGKISRKIVKQTVMTNVYGVTFVGARQQIENRLKERDDLPPDQVNRLAGYLAKKVFASLGEMFNGARKIQDWLNDSAKRISKSVPIDTVRMLGDEASLPEPLEREIKADAAEGVVKAAARRKGFSARNPGASQMTSVIWTTPLGLPIVQPYRRNKKRQVTTLLQTVYIEDPDDTGPVNSQKQSTAFPPNFIHSLDATHMLMSAVACQAKGLTFASVHDSYWTHACDVDTMNRTLRDQFVELHRQPIMENLLAEFKERYKDYVVPAVHEKDAPVRSMSDEAYDDLERKKLQAFGFAIPDADAEARKIGQEMGLGVEEKPARKKTSRLAMVSELTDEDLEAAEEDGLESSEEEEEIPAEEPERRKGIKYIYRWEQLSFADLPPQKGRRTKILEREVLTGEHEKVQGGYGKYQGTWIPFERGIELSRKYGVEGYLRPLFDYDPHSARGGPPPPPYAQDPLPPHSRGMAHQYETAADVETPATPSNTQDIPDRTSPAPARSLAVGLDHAHRPSGPNHLPPYTSNQEQPRKRARPESPRRVGPSSIGAYNSVPLPGLADANESRGERYRSSLMAIFVHEDPNYIPEVLTEPHPPHDLDLEIIIDDEGNTCLHWAAALGKLRVVELLLQKGVNVKRTNFAGETPLIRAVTVTNNYDGQTFDKSLHMLADAIPCVDNRNKNVLHHIAYLSGQKGRSPAANYYMECLFMYIAKERGGDFNNLVNLQDNTGDTPLNIAARVGNRGLVDQLVEVGADASICNKAGIRPEDFGIPNLTRGTQVASTNADADGNADNRGVDNGAISPNGNATADFTTPHGSSPRLLDVASKRGKDLLTTVEQIVSDLDGEYSVKLRQKQREIDETQHKLHGATRELAEARKKLSDYRQQAQQLAEAQQKIKNLETAIDNELAVDLAAGSNVDTDKDNFRDEVETFFNGTTTTPNIKSDSEGKENDATREPLKNTNGATREQRLEKHVRSLQARLSAFMKNEAELRAQITTMRSQSTEREMQCKRLIATCCNIPLEQVDDLIQPLMQAVESDGRDLDLSRVAGFMTKIRGQENLYLGNGSV
ncbi:hypothetical protein BZG36_03402 [Bifiguratus adelaidae]|uniref:DNA-directed RNA polymerase n=1 Tax=Bifiguratus adelaidae TaxID=1938954 RepID=A0A261Y0C2_9FUNG|nr:hypothetical protein BZG36_03402 [Bifiguratus adelaidae]